MTMNPFSIEVIQSSEGTESQNPYSFESIEADQNTRLRSSMYGATQQNPDEVAKAVHLGRQIGAPYQAVQSNMGDVEQTVKLDYYERMLEGRPKTREFLQNPDKAALASDDVENMGILETLWNSARRGIPAAKSAIPGIELFNQASDLNRYRSIDAQIEAGKDPSRVLEQNGLSDLLEGVTTPEEALEAWREYRESAVPLIEGQQTETIQRLGELHRERSEIPLPSVVEDVMSEKTFGGALGKIMQSPGTFIAAIGPESFIQSAPGMLLAIPAGMTAGPVGVAGAVGGNSFAVDYASQLTEGLQNAGIDISDSEAVRAALKDPELLSKITSEALRHASVVGAFDAASGGIASKILLPRAIAGKLASRPFTSTLTNIAVQTPVQGVMGMAGEAGGQLAAGQELRPGEILAEGFGEMFGTPGEVVSASAGKIRQQMRVARQAQAGAEVMQQVNEAAANSKLRERDPETYREFVEAVSDDAPIQSVYINANTLAQSGIVEQLAAISPSVAEQYHGAAQTGGDVSIPIAEYTANIAGTELGQALLEHVKTDPGGMSLSEAHDFDQNFEQEIKQEVERVLSRKELDAAFRQSVDVVQQNIKGKLEQIARWTSPVNDAYAELVSSFYAVQAARLGMTPEALFQQHSLNISAESIIGDSIFNQFIGENGATSLDSGQEVATRRDNLSIARQMEESGSDAVGIKLATGWERGADGLWRYEIDDSKFSFDIGKFDVDPSDLDAARVRFNKAKADHHNVRFGNVRVEGESEHQAKIRTTKERDAAGHALNRLENEDIELPLGEVVSHPELFDAYPELRNIRVNVKNMRNYGHYDEWSGVIAINRIQGVGEMHSTLLHEIQHAIQSIEGFARGGSTQANGRKYNNLSGEVEARNAERRMTLPEAARRQSLAIDTEDVSREDQIILGNVFRQEGNKKVAAALTGNEIVAAEGGDIYTEASQYFKNNLQGTVVHRPEIGDVRITGKGWKKFKAGLKIDPLKAKLTPAIRPIIEKGEYHGRSELTKPRKDDIVAFHYFSGNVLVGDQVVSVGINVGEDSRGNLFYNMNHDPDALLKKQKASGLPREYARGLKPLPDSSFTEEKASDPESSDTESDTLEQSINAAGDGVNLTILNKVTRGTFNPDTSTISLLKNADLSTFLHETGHFFLETQFSLSAMENAPESIQQDTQIILDWFGVSSMEAWNAMSFDEKRSHHEKFAQGFEKYLFEGKAPNTSLQGVFQRFRSWLINVYRSISNLGVELTDEVRGVFGRMLASTEEIELAEQGRGMLPVFENAEQAGMTPEEFGKYRDMDIDASNEAIQSLQARGMRDMAFIHNARSREINRLKQEYKERRKDVTAEVRQEVESEPIYQVWNTLTKKDGIKLSIQGLQDMYGGEGDQYALLDWKRLRDLRMTGHEGMHPDIVAEQFGFSSGDELIKRLLITERPRDIIETLTDDRMLQRHGELADEQSIELAADEAIHNEIRTRFVATEANALANLTGGRRILTESAREYARQIVGKSLVRDIRPSQYANAEARAARAAEKARKAGDLSTAATEKRNQLIQNLATKAAHEARGDVEKGLRYLRRFSREGIRKSIDVEYRDQIDQMLERFDLKVRSLEETGKRQSFRTWVQSQLNAGIVPVLPEYFLSQDEIKRYNAAVQSRDADGNMVYADEEEQVKLLADMLDSRNPTSYQNISVDEFRGVVDTVKQIEHLGRQKSKILTAQGKQNYEFVRDEIAAGIVKNARSSGKNSRTPADWLGKRLQGLRNFGAAHIKAATWARIMDGGEDNGTVWRYLIRPANDAATKESTLRADATERLNNILRPISEKISKKDRMGKGQYFQSIGESLNWEQRMAVALNFGNESNLQRLMDGNEWRMNQLLPVLQSLTSDEWNAVQQVWDMFESYRPEIAALEKKTTGAEPEWIAPRPFAVRTADGKEISLHGGYYPVVYDSRMSPGAQQHESAQSAKDMLKSAYSVATTRRSFVKSRVDEVKGRPVRLDMQGLYSGISDVIHDLSWREWVADANKLLKSRTIQNAIREHYGAEVSRELSRWRDDIVVGNKRLDHALEGFASTVRQNVSLAGLGFNLVSAALQPLGLTQSYVRIGGTWLSKGISRYLANPVEATREANEKSQWMANRTRTRFRELNEVSSQIGGQTKGRELLNRYGYFLMLRAQQVADVPTWWGAYEKAIASGEIEETAIALADQAVKDSQGGGEEVDLSSMERGGSLVKLFTVFYSFMNTNLNMGYASLKTATSKGKLAADMMMLFLVPIVLEEMLRSVMTPGEGDKEDLADWMKWIAFEHIRRTLGMFVGGREFSVAIDAVAGEGFGGYKGPAGLRMVTDTTALMGQLGRGEFDSAFWKAFLNTAGTVAGLPSAQVGRVFRGAEALYDGETENPFALMLGYRKR